MRLGIAVSLCLLPLLLPLILPLDSEPGATWATFVGRFHPLLVHYPVALVPVAWLLDVLSARERFRALGAAVPLLMLLASGSALVAFALGALLAHSEGTAGATATWHYLAAGGLVSTLLLATAFGRLASLDAPRAAAGHIDARHVSGRRWQRASRLALTCALVLTVLTGHLGGTLTHGGSYLTEFAPWRPGGIERSAITPESTAFDALVQPVFQENCATCHGTGKVKGDLRLDSFPHVMAGGKNGPVVRPGDASRSEIVRRITLPRDHDEAMPADGRPALKEEEVALLQWWITTGASPTLRLTETKDLPELVGRLVDARLEEAAGPATPLPLDQMARLARETGLVITPISRNPRAGIRVSGFSLLRGGVDESIAKLAPLASHLREADLSYSDLSDAGLAAMSSWSRVERLNLGFTRVRGTGLRSLSSLPALRTLNLAGTPLSPEAVAPLMSMSSLVQLVLSGSSLPDDRVASLITALPRCGVVAGDLSGHGLRKADPKGRPL